MVIIYHFIVNERKQCFTSNSSVLPPPTPPYTGGELVLLPEDGELLSFPSVYRGSTAKPGGSLLTVKFP